jgi:hypothetical protein
MIAGCMEKNPLPINYNFHKGKEAILSACHILYFSLCHGVTVEFLFTSAGLKARY